MLEKHKLQCPYIISRFEKHSELKQNLLSLIDSSQANHLDFPAAEVDISRSDWNISSDKNRHWVKYVFDDLMNHMLECYRSIGFDSFQLGEIWFQQYYQNSQHGWHIHGRNFTNVYYLELDKESPKTQLISPFDQKEIITLDVQEGDTVLFPSFVLHRAPPNQTVQRKTIISFNVDVGYSDDNYGKNINYAAI